MAAGRGSALVVPLDAAAERGVDLVGGKAQVLARLQRAGMRVPNGFCLTTDAYRHFVAHADLEEVVRMELARKALDDMRWEELWDAALRLRRAFLAAPLPSGVVDAIREARGVLPADAPLAVRSSAPGEDGRALSFAGIHETVTGVADEPDLLRAVRIVWASLWSDAAMLYRREMRLDPSASAMAVLVQPMIAGSPSGVAFARDPRDPGAARELVEAVPGPCADLVDGLVDPDRWTLDRSTGTVLEWRPGRREGATARRPLLGDQDLGTLHACSVEVERLVGWPPDLEWTGRGSTLTILQARPITTAVQEPDDRRSWYLGLRLRPAHLAALRRRVVDELVPALVADGERLAAQPIETLDDAALAGAIDERVGLLEHWRRVYWESFIPFAHGVRRLATYYNDAVGPEDPYEFVGLLAGERFAASERNAALSRLAERLRVEPMLRERVRQAMDAASPSDAAAALPALRADSATAAFVAEYDEVARRHLDTTFEGERLSDRPDVVLSSVLAMAEAPRPTPSAVAADGSRRVLEDRLLDAVGVDRRAEALDVLATARVSWRLRDDDNLLLGRVESQVLRALEVAVDRLRATGRLTGKAVGERHAGAVAQALRHAELHVEVPDEESSMPAVSPSAGAVRQLVGQPAAAGLATGPARRVRHADDLANVRPGDVLVCDAIQPSMTHVLPLVVGVVEGRGGMLIHGAIIARELGLPCVNGVHADLAQVADGEVVTVDGHLGIVTVGAPDFDLEGAVRSAGGAP